MIVSIFYLLLFRRYTKELNQPVYRAEPGDFPISTQHLVKSSSLLSSLVWFEVVSSLSPLYDGKFE
jgi:hypothetical protein